MDAGRGAVFSRFAWVLYAVGLVVAGFEYAIQSQSGRGDLHGLALNGIKGFMTVSLFTTVPVELYRLCVTLQGTFASGLTQLMGGENGSIGSLTRAAMGALNGYGAFVGLFLLILLAMPCSRCSLRTSGAAASCSSRSPWAACTFSACRADTWTGSGTGETGGRAVPDGFLQTTMLTAG